MWNPLRCLLLLLVLEQRGCGVLTLHRTLVEPRPFFLSQTGHYQGLAYADDNIVLQEKRERSRYIPIELMPCLFFLLSFPFFFCPYDVRVSVGREEVGGEHDKARHGGLTFSFQLASPHPTPPVAYFTPFIEAGRLLLSMWLYLCKILTPTLFSSLSSSLAYSQGIEWANEWVLCICARNYASTVSVCVWECNPLPDQQQPL